ncbi:hypothetical protein [Kitasatospora sp. NPDC090091]|uniref:hypothetical protein n=1 Tax=Kitasatospora sp. NPDC090091 TaxID=3364081 RepID=UPI0038231C57
MNQGIWTIIGVLVGSGGAVTSAFITSRGARRHQLLTQQRDKRREAYAALLRAAHTLSTNAYPHAANGYPLGGPTESEQYTPVWVDEVTNDYRELCAAFPLIALEGPEEVSEAAQKVLGAAFNVVQSADSVVQPDFAGTPASAVMSARTLKLSDAVDSFLAVSRKTLNP